MRSICIVPARGGSKRLPRKNILPVDGVPMVGRVISSALSSGVFQDVIVSTDDDEIGEISKAYGALLHRRPVHLGADRASVVEVVSDVLETFDCDDFCCVYATAALLSAETLRASASEFRSRSNIDVLMGVSKYNYAPVQALKVDSSGYAKLLMEEFKGVQSQFYPEMRVSNGTLYWARTKSFKAEKTFYSAKLGIFDVPDKEVCDVDTHSDYQELLSRFQRSGSA